MRKVVKIYTPLVFLAVISFVSGVNFATWNYPLLVVIGLIFAVVLTALMGKVVLIMRSELIAAEASRDDWRSLCKKVADKGQYEWIDVADIRRQGDASP